MITCRAGSICKYEGGGEGGEEEGVRGERGVRREGGRNIPQPSKSDSRRATRM